MRYKETAVTRVADLLENLRIHESQALTDVCGPTPPINRLPIWFRGHKGASQKLVTTLSRSGLPVTSETALMNRWKQNAAFFLNTPPENEWEWMFLMRHHRAPSRLLDWTESAIVGLYFAVERPSDPKKKEEAGLLWALLPTVLNEFARVKTTGGLAAIPMFGELSSGLDNYMASRIPEAGPSVPPAAGIALRNSPRMSAQQSVFTISHADQRPLHEFNRGLALWRYRIPPAAKPTIRDELRRLGVNRLSVYPELDSVSLVAEEVVRA